MKTPGVHGIALDPTDNKAFISCGRDSSVVIVNLATLEFIAKVKVTGANPDAILYDKFSSKVFVYNGRPASATVLDNVNHRLFSVCDNKMMVVTDAMSGKVIGTVDIGEGTDGCAFDPILKRAYSSNGEGTLTVVQQENADKYVVLGTLPTQKGARTICLDHKTHHLYLPTAEFGPAPAPTADNPNPRPVAKPGTFRILEIAPVL